CAWNLAGSAERCDICDFMRLLVVLCLCGGFFPALGQFPCDVSVSVTAPTCPDDADGSIAVTPNVPGQYSYMWGHDGSLQSSVATGLAVGPYTVVVYDTTGCFSMIDTVVMPPMLAPLGSITTTNISCAGMNDGSITLTVNPGPYTWQWVDDPTITTTTRTDLGPNMYVAVINGGACPSYVFAELGDPAVT